MDRQIYLIEDDLMVTMVLCTLFWVDIENIMFALLIVVEMDLISIYMCILIILLSSTTNIYL
jgi:hypothetical protein